MFDKAWKLWMMDDLPYSVIIERLRDGLVFLDARMNIAWANNQFCDSLGYAPEQVAGRPVTEFLEERDRQVLRSRWVDRKTGDRTTYELTFRRRDGSRMVCLIAPQPLFDPDGTFKGSFGILADITALKDVERSLQQRTHELEARARGLKCHRELTKVTTDPKLGLGEVLQRIANLLPSGMEQENAVCARICFEGMTYPSDRFQDGPLRIIRKIVVDGRAAGSVEVVCRDRHGQSANALFQSHDRELIEEIAGDLARHIERRRAIESLQIAERVMQRSPAVLYRAGPERPWPITYLFGNTEHFGYSIRELIEDVKTLEAILMPGEADCIEANAADFMKRGIEQFTQLYRIRAKDGSARWMGDSTRVLRDAHGAAISLEGIVVDVTERRSLIDKHHAALIQTVRALASAFEKRDFYTSGHQGRVAGLAVAIGRELNLPPDRIEGLYFGALIHDIGKINVPSEILSKPNRLSAAEYEIVKAHCQVGYDIVKDIDLEWPVAAIIAQHHERLDGSGYPYGLKGDEIALEARIVGVADVAEAMVNPRPYRGGLGIDAMLGELRRRRGTAYDSQAVDACVKIVGGRNFPLVIASPALELAD
jgi:PAS domain S-box-containing protein